MENQEIIEKKSKRNFVIAIISVVALSVGFPFLLIWILKANGREMAAANTKIQQEQSMNSTCTYKRDSLLKEVKRLSIYESLTKAMVHRDEATLLLKYKVGDFVFIKRDSSKAVVSDIIIGGSKYEYYIKYKVLYKDNSTEEIIPELIY